MRLANKTAIITGGGSGIGQACAWAFYQEGANVVLFGRREDKLKETAQELGSRAMTVSGDMTRNEDLDRLVPLTELTDSAKARSMVIILPENFSSEF